MSRATDGRVVFVRHALPGERVVAEVTSETSSFLRADAVEVLERSRDRVEPPCPRAGPGRCGGCDWQHVALPAQRALKKSLVEEQLRRVARIEEEVEIEEVAGSPDGLGWRTRVRFAVDRTGRIGLHRHRSHDIEPVEHCPLATDAVNGVGVGAARWRGAHHVEVTASPDGGPPVVAVETGRRALADPPALRAGLVVNGRTRRRPAEVAFRVGGERFSGQRRRLLAGAPGSGVRPHGVRPGGPGPPTGGAGRRPLRRRRTVHRAPGPGRRPPGIGRGRRAERPGVCRRRPQRRRPAPGGDRPVRSRRRAGGRRSRHARSGGAGPGPRGGRPLGHGRPGGPPARAPADGLRLVRPGLVRPRPPGGARRRLGPWSPSGASTCFP